MPPPNGSIGSITDGSTSTAETFRQQNWRTPTTVKPSPAIRSGAQKQSDRTRRGDSHRVRRLTKNAVTPDRRAQRKPVWSEQCAAMASLRRGVRLSVIVTHDFGEAR